MRPRTGIATVVAAALLCVAIPGAAQAATPANEVFYPVGEEPAQSGKADAKPDKSAKADARDDDEDEAADLASAGLENNAGASDDAPTEIPDSASDREREIAHARGSRMAADLMGWMPSLYQGKWYMPGKEDRRKCILDRESNYNYRASNGVYHGAYQMSAALARGATWMMQKEVKREMGDEGVAIVKALRKLTPNKWNRYWQDRAFWTIWRNGSGSNHWRGGANHC